MTLKIRHRSGFRWSPPKGESQHWDEYQVVGFRGNILSRHDFEDDAEKWIEDHPELAE